MIKNSAREMSAVLGNLSNNGAKRIEEFTIYCSQLDDYNLDDITLSGKYKSLFEELKRLDGPCLYYFEIFSNNSSEEIVDAISNYRNCKNARPTPAIKSNYNRSKILYVGKVKRLMWGRLIQHLGFHKAVQNQGLQLFYWAKIISLELKLVVIEFRPEMENLMEIMEFQLAQELKPIIGKHN